jgi:hypothetical protein
MQSVAGSNMMLVSETGCEMDVRGFADSSTQIFRKVPVATCATLYQCPKTGKETILVFHECLYFGDNMPGSLLNPNQLHHHGVQVDDVAKQFETLSHYLIVVPGMIQIPLT